MSADSDRQSLQGCLAKLTRHELSPLDLLGDGSLAEKLIGLVLAGPPAGGSARLAGLFRDTLERLRELDTRSLRLVTLGGGTGLSNIIGGDSRQSGWADNPFTGLKEIFPNTTSIVCVTDDGGSTGELLKDLPLVALGDLRHVLLSSIRRDLLHDRYGLEEAGARQVVAVLHRLCNHRFVLPPPSPEGLAAACGLTTASLPPALRDFLRVLLDRLFRDERLAPVLSRPQCLGNLLLASAIFGHLDPEQTCAGLIAEPAGLEQATLAGLAEVAAHFGAPADAVLPCTTTPARLQFRYGNGVQVTGENKSGHGGRNCPVDRAMVEFCRPPELPAQVAAALREADVIVFAPGSLYSSIIPILQVPGLAALIRDNRSALKILVGNIWVQVGETDATRDAPERKFHVSDLVRAYNRTIPGGVAGLFTHVLALGLKEIPGSVLQRYALEDKEPIYLDRPSLRGIGFEPVEADIFSANLLRRRGVIQHDPGAVAQAVRTLACLRDLDLPVEPLPRCTLAPVAVGQPRPREEFSYPCQRHAVVRSWLADLPILAAANGSGTRQPLPAGAREPLVAAIADILWRHPDILLAHLRYVQGLILVEPGQWSRCQEWDSVFSFYAPEDGVIMLRADQAQPAGRLEMPFLVALGQSLLGNYARTKTMTVVREGGEEVGRIFQLTLRDPGDRVCYFQPAELDAYLRLARLRRGEKKTLLYTRLVSGDEGFTPPGLLFGLFYAWYLDNRHASHIEYKMSILRTPISDLIPEQARTVGRREGLVNFFRDTVFRHHRSLPELTPPV